MAQIMRLDLACAIVAGLEFANACGIDIEADHRRALSAERNSDRQPDISKTDDGELATVRHDLPLMKPRCGPSYPAPGAVRNGPSSRLRKQALIERDHVAADTLA